MDQFSAGQRDGEEVPKQAVVDGVDGDLQLTSSGQASGYMDPYKWLLRALSKPVNNRNTNTDKQKGLKYKEATP